MNKNVGWQRVLGLLVPYFLISGFFQLIGLLIVGVKFGSNINNLNFTIEQFLILSIFDLLAVFLLIWIFTTVFDEDKFINLGFHLENKFKEFLYGFLVGVLIISLGFLTLLLLNEITILKTIFDFKNVLFSSTVFIIVAIVEETLFRGYILKNLMISFNKYIALIISSLLFALAHGANPNLSIFSFLDLFLAGILLGISYVFTKNLWFPIALHFSWNLFQTFFGFNVSGQDFYSIIEFKITENNLLNGGDFGFEGSILSIVLQIIFIVGIWVYYRNQERIKV